MQQESDSQLSDDHPTNPPTPKQIRRWQQYLANERAEAAVYRELARNREGEEKEILLAMAKAEERHEQYWRTMLGDDLGFPRPPSFSTRIMGFLAKRFGTVFTLAMMQTAESRSPYADDADATEQMTADEAIHAEVVRGLAGRGRGKMSGNFRAAVFGANDGLVSNFALVLGVMGAGGIDSNIILLTGISGMLAGALSMGAGEYISVKSQNELLEASHPHLATSTVVPQLDVDANELALVYRARGMSVAEAKEQADKVFAQIEQSKSVDAEMLAGANTAEDETLSSPWMVAAWAASIWAAAASCNVPLEASMDWATVNPFLASSVMAAAASDTDVPVRLMSLPSSLALARTASICPAVAWLTAAMVFSWLWYSVPTDTMSLATLPRPRATPIPAPSFPAIPRALPRLDSSARLNPLVFGSTRISILPPAIMPSS